MSEWKKVKLGDICDSQYGYTASTIEDNTGTKFLRITDIVPNQIDWDAVPFCNISNKERDKYILHKGDIVVARTGATVGYAKYIKQDVQSVFASYLVRFVVKREDVFSQYVGYCVESSLFKDYINSIANGSAQPNANSQMMSSFEFIIPSLPTQHHIAAILSRYDSLIENYQKQIKLLEEAAQRLYKEWFVDLHFPGHENTKIIDGVPEGWEKKRLSDIANIIMGQSPKSEFYNTEGDGIPFHQGVGSYGYRFVVDNVYSTSFTRIAEPNSILFSVRAPVGRLNITKNKIVIGRGLASINHKMGYQSYLYYLLKEKFFKDNIIGNGAIFASISKDELYNLVFFIPSDEMVKRYEAIANKIDKNIQSVDSQIRLLTEARDRLLPKLMSGEIAV
ncbi:MAG: restriction endonuclease subunit S [Prevotella sp.]|nr:restriction endonuclease subunit S [Prevotella sp.]